MYYALHDFNIYVSETLFEDPMKDFVLILPVQLIGFPLHWPVCKHVLVTFPSTLAYPLWHPNTQFDSYVLPQETVNRVALAGMLKGGQVIA